MERMNYRTLYFDDTETAETGSGENTNKPAQNTSPDVKKPETKPAQNTPEPAPQDEKKYTEAELNDIVNNIVGKKFAKWEKQKAAEVDEAAKLASMTAQERAEHERDKLKAELDELKRANARAEMEKIARNTLQTDGVTVPDEIIAHLVGDDAETTSATVKAFSKAFKAAVQAEVKAQLSHKPPVTGATGKSLTREDIRKEKDPIKRQMMISDNMSLYRKQ